MICIPICWCLWSPYSQTYASFPSLISDCFLVFIFFTRLIVPQILTAFHLSSDFGWCFYLSTSFNIYIDIWFSNIFLNLKESLRGAESNPGRGKECWKVSNAIFSGEDFCLWSLHKGILQLARFCHWFFIFCSVSQLSILEVCTYVFPQLCKSPWIYLRAWPFSGYLWLESNFDCIENTLQPWFWEPHVILEI